MGVYEWRMETRQTDRDTNMHVIEDSSVCVCVLLLVDQKLFCLFENII